MKIKYFTTASGKSPVLDFIKKTPKGLQEKFIEAVMLLESGRQISMPHSRNLSNIRKGLHELRLKDSSGIYRVFYFIKVKQAIYLVHAFKKKTQKTPQKEINTTLKRLDSLK